MPDYNRFQMRVKTAGKFRRVLEQISSDAATRASLFTFHFITSISHERDVDACTLHYATILAPVGLGRRVRFRSSVQYLPAPRCSMNPNVSCRSGRLERRSRLTVSLSVTNHESF